MEIKKKIAAVLAAATTLMSTFGAMGVSALTEPIVGDKMGDINKDDNITVADYVMLSNYLTGQGELTEEEAFIADMTRDGVLSVFDQILLGRTVLGERLPELVEKETETTEPTEPTTEPVTEAETTEPATEAETDPTEAVTTTKAPETTAVTETTTTTAKTTTVAEVTTTETTTTVSCPYSLSCSDTEIEVGETVRVYISGYDYTVRSWSEKIDSDCVSLSYGFSPADFSIKGVSVGTAKVTISFPGEGSCSITFNVVEPTIQPTTTGPVVTTVVEVPTTVSATTTETDETTVAVTTTVTDVVTTTEAVETTTAIIINSKESCMINDLSGSIEGVSFTINSEDSCNGAVQVYNSAWKSIGQIAFNNEESNDVVIDFTTVEDLDVTAIKHMQFMIFWPEETDIAITNLLITIDGEAIDPTAKLPEGETLPYEVTLEEKDFDTLVFSVNPGETEWYGGAVQAFNAAGDKLVEGEFAGNGAMKFEVDFSEIDTTKITTLQILYYYGGNSETGEGVPFTVYDIEYVNSVAE